MSEDGKGDSVTVKKSMDVQGNHFIYQEETEKSLKVLDYDYKRCTGCGLCVVVCPVDALELGPIKEIATGMDSPPVMMDIDKCTFCGMCAGFCPVKAFKMDITGQFPQKDEYPKLDSGVQINEKCLPCTLCERSCPEDAITVEFLIPKKDEIAPFDESAEGSIEIDENKCNLCGVCSIFCEAFVMVEREPDPVDPLPYEQILVDEDKCDYCGLCVGLCPEDAIRTTGGTENKYQVPSLEGKVTIDDDLCTRCSWCSAVCPYDAVCVKKPFEGQIILRENNVEKCDPHGCHGCFNVCPSHLWYVPENNDIGHKIAMKDEYCIYCGACVNACPHDVMKVSREKVRHTDIPESPWAFQWKDAIESIVTSKRCHPDTSRSIELEKEGPKEYVEVKIPEVDESYLIAAKESLEKAKSTFKNMKFRKRIEKSDKEDQ
ncbi:4Fe-4S ferredoxin iron-sulfur binding domain protein [Methanosalsum zhilinae DSM 4017]|uniref:4Fe-4S ferredoxin iron-sulfur binding domain protein n=1 Tax=Methanosalsum zhilinae (strain DSM 4017 / NBRC 107636 / OCM 62 / WeN5) TaxID=679901 RepID=F7XK57_METZD|nr:4Fe-4S binding protein [Methanosalsum zhilinae]AEH60522.1 4Fe-4S ferredoxin iron-sulfur binding domain protein [Methanosalsum zhilinae DSM 4017]